MASLRHPTAACCYLFVLYKPFMWCRSDARLRHACYLIIIYKPFMWRRSDAWLRHVVVYLLFISPLCAVAQTPDCGMFAIYLSLISPLCGVAQTPDCGIVKFICNHSRSHFRHSVGAFYFYSRIACSYFSCMRASQIFVYFVTDVMIIEYSGAWLPPCYIIPVF